MVAHQALNVITVDQIETTTCSQQCATVLTVMKLNHLPHSTNCDSTICDAQQCYVTHTSPSSHFPHSMYCDSDFLLYSRKQLYCTSNYWRGQQALVQFCGKSHVATDLGEHLPHCLGLSFQTLTIWCSYLQMKYVQLNFQFLTSNG